VRGRVVGIAVSGVEVRVEMRALGIVRVDRRRPGDLLAITTTIGGKRGTRNRGNRELE
jgi:hypothetical protein